MAPCFVFHPFFGTWLHGMPPNRRNRRQDAQVGQVSEVVNNKLSEFSEQISHLDSGDGS
jgi:hypothetical protein